MRWTGADIIAQLEDGWEHKEIARATGLGMAEVRRLEREERHKMRVRQSKEEAREMIEKQTEEAKAPERAEQVKAPEQAKNMHTPQLYSELIALPGAPAKSTLYGRMQSTTPRWAHYVREQINGVWHGHIAEGYGWGPIEVKKPERAKVSEASYQKQLRRARLAEADVAKLEETLTALKTDRNEWVDRAKAAEARVETLQADREHLLEALATHWEISADEVGEWSGEDLVAQILADQTKATSGHSDEQLSARVEELEAEREKLREEVETEKVAWEHWRKQAERRAEQAKAAEARVEEQRGEIDQLREALRAMREEMEELQARATTTTASNDDALRGAVVRLLDAADTNDDLGWPLYRVAREVGR